DGGLAVLGLRGAGDAGEDALDLLVAPLAGVRILVEECVAIVDRPLAGDDVVVRARDHRVVDLHAVEVRGVDRLLRLVALVDEELDAHAAEVLLHEALDLAGPRLGERDVDADAQDRAVLDAVAAVRGALPAGLVQQGVRLLRVIRPGAGGLDEAGRAASQDAGDRKSTRLNSSHVKISYAVFCLKKKK